MENKKRKRIRVRPGLFGTKDDKKHLQPDRGTLGHSDVKDSPEQEHIKPKLAGEIADAHIASKDEEPDYSGTKEKRMINPGDGNVSAEEKELLRRSSESMATDDDEKLRQSAVDNSDDEGEQLNEKTGLSGKDLDVPGSEEDDDDEEIGEEDEENNLYSQAGEREDEGTDRE